MNENQDAEKDVQSIETLDVQAIYRKALKPNAEAKRKMDREFIQQLLPETGTKTLAAPTIYLTDGELIPWKSNWWRVQLREINGEKLLTLVKVKPTAASERRSKRAERWNEQHAKQPGVKRELKAMSRLIHGGGALFGSQESQPEQA